MAAYKFDGTKLKRGGTTIANVSGYRIRKGTGSTAVANIAGDRIRQGTGSTVMANVSGDRIRLGTGSTTIGSMKDAQKAIDGPGGVTLAALWFCFVR